MKIDHFICEFIKEQKGRNLTKFIFIQEKRIYILLFATLYKSRM